MPMHSHDEKERGCPSPGGDTPQPNFRGLGPRNYVRPDDRTRLRVKGSRLARRPVAAAPS